MFHNSGQSVMGVAFGMRALGLACIGSCALLTSVSAMASNDSFVLAQSEQLRQELRTSVRLPSAPIANAPVAAPAPHQLNPQERAALRKQLSRDLRAQAGGATTR